MTFKQAREDPDFWGRLVETAVGAHLANGVRAINAELFYWRDRNREVDFVVKSGRIHVAIEVKSGRGKSMLRGMEALSKEFRVHRKLLVGGEGIALEEFFLKPIETWLT